MSYRYDLTDAQWQRIADFFPDRYHHGRRGHPWKEHRRLVNGILWHLHTGAPWPDTPERYGAWQTVYDRFNRWRKDGTWAKILDALLLRLDCKGCIRRDLWCVDATVNRAGAAAAGAEALAGQGGGRQGLQLRPGARLAAQTPHPAGDPDAQG